MPGNSMTAATIQEAERLARENPKDKIKIEHPPLLIPERYEKSTLSINEGANEVYRTPGPKEHFQLRIHDDHWTVDHDNYHPQHYPVKHAVYDSPKYTAAGAVVALGAIFG